MSTIAVQVTEDNIQVSTDTLVNFYGNGLNESIKDVKLFIPTEERDSCIAFTGTLLAFGVIKNEFHLESFKLIRNEKHLCSYMNDMLEGLSDRQYQRVLDPFEKASLIVVVNGSAYYYRNDFCYQILKHKAIGSGGLLASFCLQQGMSTRESVDFAMKFDGSTGGEIQTLTIKKGRS